MPRLERPAPSVFNALLDPLGQRTAQRRTRRHEDPQAVAQDYLQYMLSDYEERRAQGHRNWRDLCPVYAFALTTHAADWPRNTDDAIHNACTDAQAALMERVRDQLGEGASLLLSGGAAAAIW